MANAALIRILQSRRLVVCRLLRLCGSAMRRRANYVASVVSMKHPEKVFRPLESELRASASCGPPTALTPRSMPPRTPKAWPPQASPLSPSTRRGRPRELTLTQAALNTASCGPATAPSPHSIPRDPYTTNNRSKAWPSTRREQSRDGTMT